jgi:exodeoxyribonuclease V alpha subunit
MLYGASSVGTVTNNPYQLATDIYGIGFITADKIARNIGVPSNSEYRYKAGIIHVLSEGAEDGHCYLPQVELVQKLVQLLKTEDHNSKEESAELIICNMALEDELIRESGACLYLQTQISLVFIPGLRDLLILEKFNYLPNNYKP